MPESRFTPDEIEERQQEDESFAQELADRPEGDVKSEFDQVARLTSGVQSKSADLTGGDYGEKTGGGEHQLTGLPGEAHSVEEGHRAGPYRPAMTEPAARSDEPGVVTAQSLAATDSPHDRPGVYREVDSEGKTLEAASFPEPLPVADEPVQLAPGAPVANKGGPKAVEEATEPERKSVVAGSDSGSAEDAPSRSAPKGEWVEYAVSQGATEEEAERSTKDQLIADYGD